MKPGEKIGSLKQLTPALLLNHHFADRKARWRPLVGIGPLYSTISDVQMDPDVQPHTTAKADKKWGLASHVALTYAVDANWHLTGALGYTRVKNGITLSTDTSKPPYNLLGLPAGTALTGLIVTTKTTTLSLTLGYGSERGGAAQVSSSEALQRSQACKSRRSRLGVRARARGRAPVARAGARGGLPGHAPPRLAARAGRRAGQ